MPPDDTVYLGHMLDMARKAITNVESLDKDHFDTDEKLQLASAHLVQIIGEAAAHVSQEYRQSRPEIPWGQIIGMRNRIVHDYMGVDFDVVWEVVSHDLPHLVQILSDIVGPAA